MANISVRKLDDEVYSKLRMLATAHGISVEEQVRQILKQTVAEPVKLGDMAVELFGEKHGVDLPLSERSAHQPLDLSF